MSWLLETSQKLKYKWFLSAASGHQMLEDGVWGVGGKGYHLSITSLTLSVVINKQRVIIQVVEPYRSTVSGNSHLTMPCLLALFLPPAVVCWLTVTNTYTGYQTRSGNLLSLWQTTPNSNNWNVINSHVTQLKINSSTQILNWHTVAVCSSNDFLHNYITEPLPFAW